MYSYPLRNQFNFYKDEYPGGYIKLKTGQANLFRAEDNGIRWEYIARLTSGAGSVETAASYNSSESTVNFNIPAALSRINHL